MAGRDQFVDGRMLEIFEQPEDGPSLSGVILSGRASRS